METPSWPALIRALIGKQALTAEQTAWAMNEIMEGAATPAQIAGFGVALRAKGETAAEMSGLAASMLAHATPISISGPVTDLVGSGGDGANRADPRRGRQAARIVDDGRPRTVAAATDRSEAVAARDSHADRRR